MNGHLNNEEILNRLNIESELKKLGIEITGRTPNAEGWTECRSIDPSRPDQNPSASVNVRTGSYREFGGTEESLSFFDLAARMMSLKDFAEAKFHYAEMVGVAPTTRPLSRSKAPFKVNRQANSKINASPIKQKNWEPKGKAHKSIEEATKAAVRTSAEKLINCRHEDCKSYRYPPCDGFLGISVRIQEATPTLPDGKHKKTFRPLCFPDGGNNWYMTDPPKWALYRSDQWNESEQIWIFEGEKCADIAARLGLASTTSQGGASGTAKTDWAPLAGKHIRIVPDNNEAGTAYADSVGAEIAKITPKPASVKIVALPGLENPKHDLEEWVNQRDGIDDADIRLELLSLADKAEELDEFGLFPVAYIEDFMRDYGNLEWVWPGWIPKGFLVGIAADAGAGKTRFILHMASTLYHGRDWPDGQPQTMPKGQKTLWICGDSQQGQIGEALAKFGMSYQDYPKSLMLAAPRDDPGKVLDLDDPQDFSILKKVIEERRPALVVLDTINNLTSKNLTKPEETRQATVPLMELAKEYGTTIIVVTHLSSEGKTLGRRLDGQCRTIIKLTAPDEEDPEHLKVAVTKSAWKKPEPLGAFAIEGGFQFGEAPQAVTVGKPIGSKRGRPSTKKAACIPWLIERLKTGPRKIHELITEAEAVQINGIAINSTNLYHARDTINADSSHGYTVTEETKEEKTSRGITRYIWWALSEKNSNPESNSSDTNNMGSKGWELEL